MKRLKESLLFALVCYGSNVFLNAIAWVIIELVPFLFHGSDPFYELQGVTLLFYIPIILLFSWLFKMNRVWIYFPVIYLILSVFATFSNSLEGWDLMFVLNFGISQISLVVYELIRKSGLLESSILNLILFNGIFFIYQVCLLYYSNKLLRKIKEKFNL
jgi:hypothetical protein